MKKTSTILAIGSALAMGSAQAEIESSFSVGYSTDYVFRGINQNELVNAPGADNSGLFEYGLDFTGTCDCGVVWNAGIWVADYGNGNNEERNFYASATKDFGAFDVSLGLIRYDFTTVGFLNTTELVLGVSTEVAGLNVAGSIYYDVDNFDGNLWGELSVGKSFDVGGGATLNVVANIGTTLDASDVGPGVVGNGDDYVTYGLKVALSKELGDNLTGTIFVSGEITDGLRPGTLDDDDLVGGISLAYGF